MTRNQLAVIVLVCTRCLIDVMADLSDGAYRDVSRVQRIANTRAAIDDYIKLVQVDDADGLREALGERGKDATP